MASFPCNRHDREAQKLVSRLLRLRRRAVLKYSATPIRSPPWSLPARCGFLSIRLADQTQTSPDPNSQPDHDPDPRHKWGLLGECSSTRLAHGVSAAAAAHDIAHHLVEQQPSSCWLRVSRHGGRQRLAHQIFVPLREELAVRLGCTENSSGVQIRALYIPGQQRIVHEIVAAIRKQVAMRFWLRSEDPNRAEHSHSPARQRLAHKVPIASPNNWLCVLAV